MSKKVKVLASILVAAVLLTVGGTVAVMAEEEEEPTPESTPARTTLWARVADILGDDISEEDLIAAFKQAQQDLGEEAFLQALDKTLEQGLIDDAEYTAINEWWTQKPESQDPEAMRQWWEKRPEMAKPGLLKRILHPFQRGHLPGGPEAGLQPEIITRVADILGIATDELVNAFRQAQEEMRAEGIKRALDKAVEKELITPEEVGEILEWWQGRPEALDRGLLPGFSGFANGYGKHMPGGKPGFGPGVQSPPWSKMQQQGWQKMRGGWQGQGAPQLAF